MKMRKELWFGFGLMAAIIIPVIVLMPWGHLTNGHLGLMMLALICVGIMIGFPTAFTLMGMGVFFAWLSYRSVDPATATQQGARPVRATHLRRDVERRADRDSAVPVHGLSRRARAADRPLVQEPASCHRAHPRVAGGGDHRHLRDLRHRDRHRRRRA